MAQTLIEHIYHLKGGEQEAVEYQNPFLERREPIIVYCSDGKTRLKIGDGKHYYNELEFINDINVNDVEGLTQILTQYEVDLQNLTDKIDEIVIDEVYNPNSENPQSGKAVAEAIAGSVSGNNIDDLKISTELIWSSEKTAKEIYKFPFQFDGDNFWVIGGLQSANGTENSLTTRMRTDYIPIETVSNLLVLLDEPTKIYVYFYSDNANYIDYSSYLGNNGYWVDSGLLLSDVIPNGTKYIRLMAQSENKDITDINAVSETIKFFSSKSLNASSEKEDDIYLDFQPDIPENIGVLNTILNFKQLAQIKYTPKNVLPQQTGDFPSGKTQKGLPYSSSRPEAGYVPNFVSLHTFMTAIQNPNSYLYTVDLGELGNQNGDTYYGAVCSTACGYALGILPNYSTHQWKDIPDMEALEWQSVYALKLGDTICSRVSGHVVMVTDITRNKRGRIGKITITEASGARVQSALYTPEELEERYPSKNYIYYRYNKIYNVKHIQSPFVAVEDEVPQEFVYNTAIIPRKGDRANWLVGQDVEIDILKPSNYNSVEVYKNDSLLDEISLMQTSESANKKVYGIWELGAIASGDGATTNSTTRIRSGYISSTTVTIDIPENLDIALRFYTSGNKYVKPETYGWINGGTTIDVSSYAPENTVLIRLMVRYHNDATISDAQSLGDTIEIKETTDILPICFMSGGFNSKDGSEASSTKRIRSLYLPLENWIVNCGEGIEYQIYYYNENKEFISYTTEWTSESVNILENAPNDAFYIRFIVRKSDDTDIYATPSALLKFNVSIPLSQSNIITLKNLEYGSYKARLTNGTNYSDWCYWIVVDAISAATPTGNSGEIKVDFSASNAIPVFVSWSNGVTNGTVHISVPTEDELAAGSAICTYQAGTYKVRVAFQTEYGVIHSELPNVITVT